MEKSSGRKQHFLQRRQTGQAAEELAVLHLQEHGYQILHRNWRTRSGEIDIVARLGSLLVFVEVRSRTAADGVHVLESIPIRKQMQVRKMAELFLAGKRYPALAEVRLDAVLVEFYAGQERPVIIHIENAF